LDIAGARVTHAESNCESAPLAQVALGLKQGDTVCTMLDSSIGARR
jgi:hypothetical protein